MDGVLKFCIIVVEHQVRTGRCVKCGNVTNVHSLHILTKHILRRGMRPQYHFWVWYGDEGIYKGKIVPLNVHEEKGFAYKGENNNGYKTYEKVVNEDVDCVDEMIKEVENELEKSPCAFDL